MKGYKVFNPDMTCKGFKFEVGKTYKVEGNLIMCKNGFHFCEKLKNCYNYYDFSYKNPVCEVEAIGETLTENDKTCTSEIKIFKMLSLEEILTELNLFCSSNEGSGNTGSSNEGSSNTGSSNEGSSNKGSWNKGSENTGSENTGSSNKGSWNKGSENTGSLNTGSENTGSSNKGSGNEGSENTGSENTGSSNTGSSNEGSSNTGSSNKGSWNKGSSNTGSWNKGSLNTGSLNTGSENKGSNCVGFFNLISYKGTKENCSCFDESTGVSFDVFKDKYKEIIKEIEQGNLSNISNFPNYTEKRWDKFNGGGEK